MVLTTGVGVLLAPNNNINSMDSSSYSGEIIGGYSNADRARNEPRDLYDLWYLTSNEGIELGALVNAMRQKLEFRGRPIGGIAESIRDHSKPCSGPELRREKGE